jgi:hypothetical protein
MDLPENILDKAYGHLKDGCIISGGHFRIFFDSKELRVDLNNGTIKSFEYAVKLYLAAVKKNIKADLGILVNDMGSSCEEDGCHLKSLNFLREDYVLPHRYTDILAQNGLKNSAVKIFWEKHIRNRSKKELLKILKKQIIHNLEICPESFQKRISKNAEFGQNESKRDMLFAPILKPGQPDIKGSEHCNNIHIETSGIFISDPEGYGKIILTKTQGKDKYGTPACPLIMSGLNFEQSKSYTIAINFYYVGQDNMFNIPNYFVIEKGKKVSDLFGCKMSVENLYFQKLP